MTKPNAKTVEQLDDLNADVRMAAAEAILNAGAPKLALAKIAGWIDDAGQPHWLWMVGVSAVLKYETPAKAFQKLASKLADKKYAERVLKALEEYDGDVDPRFFQAAA